MYRTHTCGELRIENVGQTVTLAGWVQKSRKLGGMTFVDLRDRYGITQLVVDAHAAAELVETASSLGREWVIQVTGEVVERQSKNPKMPTGDVEISLSEIKVLNKANTPPFTIEEDSDGGEELRAKYRYLDLRRGPLQRALKIRHQIAHEVRNYLDAQNFLEIETPYLIKSTPEGARDFVVPSRMNPGQFYALPQSPQTFKQLLMVAGYDRYIQIARCFRDEDLRADRQPEFTQIDLEMSFVTQEDVMQMNEGFIKRLFKELLGIELPDMPRMTYADAMNLYGSDKPDTRFDMKINDLSAIVANCGFGAFSTPIAEGGSVRAIVAKNSADKLTRKEIDKLTEHAKGIGAKGLAYIRWSEDAPNCSFAKFMTEDELKAIYTALGLEKGDTALICAGPNKIVLPVLGALRGIVARKLDIIPKNKYNFLWITEFPFFEWDEESASWVAMHHPFTMPLDECLDCLENDPGNVRAKAYDMVLNGIELLSGSIRITDWQLQEKMFNALGLTKEEIEAKFGFLVDAYKYGAPPHGGSGMGLDRLAMVITEAESLRDVIAFPKVQNASEIMSACPSPVAKKDLDVLGIAVIEEE